MNDSLGHDDQLGTTPGSGDEAGISQEGGGQGRGRPEENVSLEVSFLAGSLWKQQNLAEGSFRNMAGLVVKYCLLNVPVVLFGLGLGTISEGFNVTSSLMGIAAASAVWLGFGYWVTNTERDRYVTALRALGVEVKWGKSTPGLLEGGVDAGMWVAIKRWAKIQLGWQEPQKTMTLQHHDYTLSISPSLTEPNEFVMSIVSNVPVSGSTPPRQLFDTEDLSLFPALAAAGVRLSFDTAKLPVPRTA